MSQTDDLREAALRATPGPWYAFETDEPNGPWGRVRSEPEDTDVAGNGDPLYIDAAYIALASPDRILAICEENDKLRAALERIANAMELGTYGVSREDIAAVARAALEGKPSR